jgi:hypothetical protein
LQGVIVGHYLGTLLQVIMVGLGGFAGCYCGMLLLGVISKIKQNSSDMNEIILASCDGGYVQNCTG